MKIQQVQKLSAFKRLIYWITEREKIRVAREDGEEKPWTDDEILQSYRFCNVIRMDDKVSQWLLHNWYEPNFGHKNMVVACALARFLNKPETLEQIGFPKIWQPRRIEKIVRRVMQEGVAYNAAYMVAAGPGTDKINSIVDHYCQPLLDNPPRINTDSKQETWEALSRYHGFGSFMAGQVTADLVHALSGLWGDRQTWACMGPGSARGLNRLCERDIKTGWTQEQFLTTLRKLFDRCKKVLPEGLTDRMELSDLQSCLCEFDKFERILHGQGTPKQKYNGRD